MDKVTFRKAALADTEALIRCRKAQFLDEGYGSLDGMETELYDYFTNALAGQDMVQIVGESEGAIVCTGAVLFFRYPPSDYNCTGWVAYVAGVYTAPPYRHQGLASKVLELLEEEAERRGVTTMQLNASEQAVPVYERAGYEVVSGDFWMEKYMEGDVFNE